MFGLHRLRSAGVVALATGLGMLAVPPVAASEPMRTETLEAIVRALGFLESAPRDGAFEIAVAYTGDGPDAHADAETVGGWLNDMPGPKRTHIRATPYSLADLLATSNHIDALLLVSDARDEGGALADFVRDRRLLAVSDDRGCLAEGFCVLMVSADRDVEIVLDTRLARHVGAQFSTVFTMMVARK